MTRDGAKASSMRRAPRLATRLSAVLQGRSRYEVEILDLSLRGCLARCPVALDRGQVMDLTLTMSADPVAVKVRVADTSQDGESAAGTQPAFLTGLEFMMLAPDGEHLLRQFLNEEQRRRRAHA
jgi:hypothetical protein